MVPFLIAGLTTGSIFGLAAVGLVLTYKTTGIFNFAQGALATAGAFFYYFFRDQVGLPWPVASLLAVVMGGVAIGALLELGARRLAGATLITKVLATIGLLLVIEGAVELLYPPEIFRQVTQFLPDGSFTVAGVDVQTYQVIIFAIGVATVAILTVFLRRSRTGVAMRAIVESPALLGMMGFPPTRIRRLAWIIGSSLAAASGVLLAPLVPLDATTLTELIVTAFGAAALGGFTSLPLTYVGGLAIGVGQAIIEKYFPSTTSILAGLASSLPFLVLLAVLIFAPRLRAPLTEAFQRRRSAPESAPWQIRALGMGGVLIVLVLVPGFAGGHLLDWTTFLTYVLLFLSLGLLVRVSGQISLCHVAFMAIGVCAFSQLASDNHWPWLIAFLAASLVAAPIGALLAIPAIRFSGLYLALATLGFGLTLEVMFYNQPFMFGSFGLGIVVPRPHLSWLDLSSDRGYYYFVLFAVVLVSALMLWLSRSRLGRLLRGLADSPTGVAASGGSINVTRVLVFSLSAALAAMAGILNGGVLGLATGDNYPPLLSLQLFALIMLTVGDVPVYALLAAAAQALIPAYISAGATVGYAFTLLFGLNAIAFSMMAQPPRLPARVRRLMDRLAKHLGPGELRRKTGSAGSTELPRTQTATAEPVLGSGLAVDSITVRFGGLVAADEITLTARPGRITGLIGPNGAGKTTIFNACCGNIRPSRGDVRLNDQSVRRLGPPSRARRGLGRTFQQTELFDSLTVRQNVELGGEAAFAGWNPLDHLIARPWHRRVVQRRATDALEICGIESLANSYVHTLSTGHRRLVELARCLAGSYEVLLLDEPSSGLDRVETEKFGETLRRVISERDIGILLIEHDIALVSRLCDYVYVVDFGKQIFEGTMAEAASSQIVREAYLGALPGRTAGAGSEVVEARG